MAYAVGAQWDDPLVGDAIYYSAQADAIAEGRWFEHPYTGEAAADHPPVTALVLAPASWLPGDVLHGQRLLGALLGVVAVVAIAALGREVGGTRVALIAGGVAAIYPGLWINDGLIMSETATAIVTALLLRAILRWRRAVAPAWIVGVLGGVAVLTRAELALLVVLACVPVVISRTSSPSWRDLAVIALSAGAVVLPWTVRNLLRFEEPVLISTNDGLTLLGANCDNSYDGPGLGFWDLRCAPPVEGDQSEVSATYRRMAVDYVQDHLGEVPRVVAARVGRVWSLWRPTDQIFLNQGEDREPWASRAALWGFWALAPVSLAGLVLLRRRGLPWWPLAATAVTVTVTAALFYGIVRFRLPAEVAMVVAAAVALAHLWDRVRRPAEAPAG